MLIRRLLLLHLVCLVSPIGTSKSKSKSGSQVTLTTYISVLDDGVNTQRTSLECMTGDTFTSTPVLNAIWTKDGNLLVPNERIKIYAENVTIDPVLPEDEGTYCCNNSEDFELTTPPHVIESEEVLLMHELGPEVRLECGIRLGNLSRRKAYEVNWQRVLGKDSIIIISSCMGPNHNEDDTAGVQDDCKAEFDFEDFSLTRSNVEPDDNGRAVFKCIVNIQFEPSSNPHARKIRDVDTIVMFYEPAAIHPSLPTHTLIHSGDGLTLSIGFSGDPLEPITWERNGEPLTESLVNEDATTSTIFLAPEDIEQGDRIRATVNVLNKSSEWSETLIVILYPIQHVSVTRPPAGECAAPVLTLSLPDAIPVPQTTAHPQPIQLLIEYTRIDRESNHDGSTPDETGIITKAYNASGLGKSSTLEMPLDNLPYMLLSWEAYVVRVRLKVLGEFSRQWSSYSTPFCVHCMECMNAPSVKINLRLSFPENSKLCSNMGFEGVKALVGKLLTAIQESCPDYLCRDLTLANVSLTCSGETAGVLTATASGIGTERNVRSFLRSINEDNPPLRLSLNGTPVEVSSVVKEQKNTTPESDRSVREITGSTVGVGLSVLLTLVLTYSAWRWKKSQAASKTSTYTEPSNESGADAKTTRDPAETTPPRPPSRDLCLQDTRGDESPQQRNLPLPPSPNGSQRYETRLLQLQSPLPTKMESPHHPTPSLHSHSQHSPHSHHQCSPLTMSQAGNLAQMEGNLEDTSSVDTSPYAPHSEISFALTGSTSVSNRPLTPLSSKRSVYYGESLLPSSESVAGYRSRRNLSLPLSRTSDTAHRTTPCTCTCHSRESTPLPSPSLSGGAPFHQRGSPMRRSKTTSPLLSPWLSAHYQLWTNNRAASPWSKPRLHLPRQHGASESPV